MIQLLIVLAYLVVGFVVARKARVTFLDKKCDCSGLKYGSGKHTPYCDGRFCGDTAAVMFGTFWPLGWLYFPILWVASPTPQEKRAQREIAAEEELRQLKTRAKEMGLPL